MSPSGAVAVTRVARRDMRRHPWRSLLVVLLVMLPVGAMVGAAAILHTVTPTPDRVVAQRMGRADLVAYPRDGATADELRAMLPADSRLEPVRMETGRLALAGLEVSVTLASLDLDGLAAGMLSIIGGRAPASASEVAVSAAVSDLAGAGIGDTVTLEGLGSPVVVGLVENELDLTSRVVLLDPAFAADGATDGLSTWLVGVPAGVGRPGGDLRQAAGVEGSFDITTRDEARIEQGGQTPTVIVLGGLALVEAALVASAAFAVSIRRRQRELGLLAASGADSRHLAGTVIAEAVLIGTVAVVVGVVLGIGGAIAISPWLDALTDRRNPPIGVAPELVLFAAGTGLLAALVAALAPAWTAARLPVLTALSGRRPAPAAARRTLRLGVVLVVVAVAMTGAGAAVRISEPSGSLSTFLLLGGAVLGTLGFGACSPWLLERLEQPAARLPLVTRIAVRDTARARSRNGPIVAAVLASFAATVAVAAYTASQEVSIAASWQPWLRPDQILIRGEGVTRAGPQAAEALGATAAAPIPGIGDADRNAWISVGEGADGDDFLYNITVGSEELLRALGAEDAGPALASGSVVLFRNGPTHASAVNIRVSDVEGNELETVRLPAHPVEVDTMLGDLPSAVISPAVARRLSLPPGMSDRYLIRLDRQVTDDDLARAAGVAAAYPDTLADAAIRPPRPGEGLRQMMLVASLLFALSVTGVAVALGEAESRPEQRTLLALGAAPGVRRRIAAARAGVIAGLAGVLAVPAGLLPVWGLLSSRDAPLVAPVPEIVAAVVVLPLLAALATFLLSRPIPSWSAFRASGS